MKKRANKKLYWLIPIAWALIALLVWTDSKAGIVRNATSSQNGQDSISIPLFVLDSAGNRVPIDTAADWGYIVVRYPNGTKAASDSFMIRGTNTAKIVKDAAEFGGLLQYSYRKQISDLDGTPTNGIYSFEVNTRDSSAKLWTVVKIGEFQLYQTTTFAAANDSFTNAIKDANKVNFKDNAIGVKLAATGSDADTGIAGLKTKQTTIAGYTDDIGVAGAGLTAVRLGVRGLESDTSFATTKAKIYSLSAGSGVTLAQLDSVLDLFVSGDSLVTLIWNAASRTLTALDEDGTTIDLNGSAVGSVAGAVGSVTGNVGGNVAGSVGSIATGGITAASIADNAVDSSTFAPDAKKMIALRSDSGAVSGGTADVYPLTGIKFVVDAVGADGNSQFVSDTASLGPFSSSQNTLIHRALIVRSLGGGAVQIPTTITRVAYTGANCSLTVSIDAPKNFAANDTIQLAGLPWESFVPLAEANDSTIEALLGADTTGRGGDPTIGGSIVSGGTGGSDSTEIKAMLENNQVLSAADSTLKLAETSTGAGAVRRAETSSKAQLVDTLEVTPLIIGTNNDKTGYGLSASGIDAIWDEPKAGHTTAGTYGYFVDAAISGVSGGGSCAGTGSDTTDIFVFAASDSDQFVGVWVTYYVGAERLVAQTDSTGRARFATDGSGSYTAIVSARPFTHENAYVTLGTVDTIWMDATENAPTLTPVCGTLRNLQGQPIAGAVVTATNQASNIRIDGYTVSRYVVNVTTDQFGRFTLWLYPTAVLGGASYKYNFTAYRGSTLIESVSSITVPDQATCYEIDWTIN